MAIEKYYPKGGGHDPRAKSNDETRVMRSMGKHYDKKKKELARMSESEARSAKETPEQQRLNKIGRAGTKRPEHGAWPVFKKK